MKRKNLTTKRSTLCNKYENGRLTHVDVSSKVVNLQFSCKKRLFNNNFYHWKGINLYLVHRYLGKNFRFHSNLEISCSVLRNFPKFYQDLFFRWVIFLLQYHQQ